MNDKSGIVYQIGQNVPGSLFKDYAEISYQAYLEHTGGYNLSTVYKVTTEFLRDEQK